MVSPENNSVVNSFETCLAPEGSYTLWSPFGILITVWLLTEDFFKSSGNCSILSLVVDMSKVKRTWCLFMHF